MVPTSVPSPSGVAPGEYVYARGFPRECHGQLYRVHRDVLDVPTYQQKLLIEALTGIDRGLFFVCTLANFRARYRGVTPDERERFEAGRWGGGLTEVTETG